MLSIDPLRTRMLYVGILSRAKRKTWFQNVEERLKEKLDSVINFRNHARASVDPVNQVFMSIAHENAVMEIQTRLKWLKKAKEKLIEANLLDA